MNCPNCGLPAHDTDKFCISCGTPLRRPAVPAPEAAEEAVAPAVEEAVQEAVEPVEEAVENAAEAVNETVEEAAPAVEEAAEAIEAAAAEIPETAANELDRAIDEANEVFKPEPILNAEPVVPAEPVIPAEPVAPVIPAAPVVAPVKPAEPAAAPVKTEPKAEEPVKRLDKPLSTWGYIWRILLFAIPVIGLIPLFVMAFSKGINKNSKHFSSAILILMLIFFVLAVAGAIYLLCTNDPNTISEYLTNVFNSLTFK